MTLQRLNCLLDSQDLKQTWRSRKKDGTSVSRPALSPFLGLCLARTPLWFDDQKAQGQSGARHVSRLSRWVSGCRFLPSQFLQPRP